MSRDLGRDVPNLEKLYARKLWGLIFRTLNEGHEKATEKPRKRPKHCFSKQMSAKKKPRKSHVARNQKSSEDPQIELGVFSWCLCVASYSCVFVMIVP